MVDFSDSSAIQLAYVSTADGAVPATPTWKVWRATGGGLRLNKSTVTSDERRADRNVPDLIQTGQDWAGDYQCELSYGTHDDLFAALLRGTWSTNVLKNGVTKALFAFEHRRQLGAGYSFSRFTGVQVNSCSFSLQSRSKVTMTFNAMALAEVLGTAIVSGATYTAANTKAIADASNSVSALSISSAAILDPVVVRSLNFDLTNNLRTRPAVGSKFSSEFGTGRFEATGTIELYFSSNEAYQAVLDHGSAAISFTVGTVTNEKYTFLFPKCVLGGGQVQEGGNDEDVIASIPFTAVYDATEACSLKITRAVA